MKDKGQPQLTPSSNFAGSMTLHDWPVLLWEGWSFATSVPINQGILATPGKGCGLRQGDSVQLRQSPEKPKSEGCLSEALPEAGVLILGSCSEIWPSHPSSHHKDLDSASFPPTIISILFYVYKLNTDLFMFVSYLPSSKCNIFTQEHTKQRRSKGTIISHYSFSYQKKSFCKGSPEKFSLHGAKTSSS